MEKFHACHFKSIAMEIKAGIRLELAARQPLGEAAIQRCKWWGNGWTAHVSMDGRRLRQVLAMRRPGCRSGCSLPGCPAKTMPEYSACAGLPEWCDGASHFIPKAMVGRLGLAAFHHDRPSCAHTACGNNTVILPSLFM